jgi:hypothetical protein
MLQRLFFDHPQSLGESYGVHLGKALVFALTLFRAAAACLIHAFVPAFFPATASNAVTRLSHTMLSRTQAGSVRTDAAGKLNDSAGGG